jgi:hypothetical protein
MLNPRIKNELDLLTDFVVCFVTRDAVQVLHLMLLQYINVLHCAREANASAWDVERRAVLFLSPVFLKL